MNRIKVYIPDKGQVSPNWFDLRRKSKSPACDENCGPKEFAQDCDRDNN